MNEAPRLVLAWVAGGGLGVLFFGGLWWTVRKGVSAKQPALWFVGSMFARLGIGLAGFYLVSGLRWERLLACLLGFAMTRPIVTWLTRAPRQGRSRSAQDGGHAP